MGTAAVTLPPMQISQMSPLDIQRKQVRNTKSVGKIVLLAVAAAGIYSPNQIPNGHFREDAVSRKNILCLIQTLACDAPNAYNAGFTC